MTFSFFSKNKLGFMEGLISLPNNVDLASKWHRCNAVVISWILNFVDKTLYSNLVFYTKVSNVWFDLHQTYCRIEGTRLFGLLQKKLKNWSLGKQCLCVLHEIDTLME